MAKKKKLRKAPVLNNKQSKYLKGLGHHLKPLAMLGKDGLDENLLRAVDEVLDAHELIKVKVQENCPHDRKEAAAMLAKASRAALVQVIGRTFLLYRERAKDLPPLPDDKKINIP